MFVVVLTIEIRLISAHEQPLLRAAVAMATVIPLFLVLFAWIYLTLSNSEPAAFGTTLDRTSALYFTVTVFSTVGFGDIVAKTDGRASSSRCRCSPTWRSWPLSSDSSLRQHRGERPANVTSGAHSFRPTVTSCVCPPGPRPTRPTSGYLSYLPAPGVVTGTPLLGASVRRSTEPFFPGP